MDIEFVISVGRKEEYRLEHVLGESGIGRVDKGLEFLKYNRMVIDQSQLDHIFGALADATRRGMLARLADGEQNVRSLAEPYAISQPAISKHLRVLERAGLIRRRKQGREHFIAVVPEVAMIGQRWIARYATLWKAQFDAVEERLQAKGVGPTTH